MVLCRHRQRHGPGREPSLISFLSRPLLLLVLVLPVPSDQYYRPVHLAPGDLMDTDEVLRAIDASIQSKNMLLRSKNAQSHAETAIMMPSSVPDAIPESELRDGVLRVVVPSIEPPNVNYINVSEKAPDDRGFGPGVVIEILKVMAQDLNLTYEFVPVNRVWGSLVNGTQWTGAFGQLVNGEADVIAGAAAVTFDRAAATDLTFYYQTEPMGMMIRKPHKLDGTRWLLVAQPFHWTVWLMILGFLLAGAITMLIISHRLHSVSNELQYSTAGAIWLFYSLLLQQGLVVQPRSSSNRLLLAFYWFASLTMAATFNGALVGFFTADDLPLPFYSYEQMVGRVKHHGMTVLMDGTSTVRSEMIATSSIKANRDLWKQIHDKKRVKYVSNIDVGVTLVRSSSNYVLFGPMDTLKTYALVSCDLYLYENLPIEPIWFTVPFRKGSKYAPFFSRRMRDLFERGFMQKWSNDYMYYLRVNTTGQFCEKKKNGKLGFGQSQGSFWTLAVTMIVGGVILLLEIILPKLPSVLQVCPTLWYISDESTPPDHDPHAADNVYNPTDVILKVKKKIN